MIVIARVVAVLNLMISAVTIVMATIVMNGFTVVMIVKPWKIHMDVNAKDVHVMRLQALCIATQAMIVVKGITVRICPYGLITTLVILHSMIIPFAGPVTMPLGIHAVTGAMLLITVTPAKDAL
jgi:hypothetical protein